MIREAADGRSDTGSRRGGQQKVGSDKMAWLECFYPDVYLESAYEIDYERLYREGYRGVIFDIDNTLVPHGAPADRRSIELFRRLKKIGYESVLLSNNMELMDTKPETTMFVGDQLFTDVWGAKRAGIRTWLVKPIHPREEIQIILKRRLEWIVLFFYKRSKGRYSDM